MKPAEHASAVFSAVAGAWRLRTPARPVRRVLIVGYGAIGDTIFFLPTLEAIRRAHPLAKLTWLSNPAPVADELIPATGLVDDVWKWEAQVEDPEGRALIRGRIAAAEFDLAVLTLGAPAHEFLGELTAIPAVAGHLRPLTNLSRFISTGDYARMAVVNRAVAVLPGEHALARNLRLLGALGLPSPSPASARPHLPVPIETRARAEQLLAERPRPRLGIHLGPAGGQYGKMWAPARFAALSTRLAEAWGASCILFGSADEKSAADEFFGAGGRALNLVGRTKLVETFATLAQCDVLVSSDTGVAKAAAALGVPTITLWGPSDPAEFRSPWDPDRHLDVRTGIHCSPCTWMGMSNRRLNYLNCGHRACLAELSVEDAALRVLRRWPTPPKREKR